MTPRDQVRLTRRWLSASLVAMSVLWAIASAMLAWALAVALHFSPSSVASTAFLIAVLVSVALMRKYWPASDNRVALWVEEKSNLQYQLVSAVDPSCAAVWSQLDSSLKALDWTGIRRNATWMAMRWPLVAVAVSLGALVLAPHLRAAAITRDVRARLTGAPAGPLSDYSARVTPPAYSKLREFEVDKPAELSSLAGSAIMVRGDVGKPTISLGALALNVDSTSDGWSVALRLPPTPTTLRLAAGNESRLIALVPLPDSAPIVVLRHPVADSTVRAPRGTVSLEATASDDYGLTIAAFEYVISSGSGESFNFRTGLLGTTRYGSDKQSTLHSSLDFEALKVNPGDVVHIRAVASDALGTPNLAPRSDTSKNWRSEWRGASETRTIRVARPGEYDSVAVEGAPPPETPKNALSQRMLLQLTEALEKRRPRLPTDTLRREARTIALDQARLRKRVGEIVFTRLGESSGEEGDDPRLEGKLSPDELLAKASEATTAAGVIDNENESPVVAVNKPLLEAYNHMWDAQRALEVAEPAKAIPPMRKAILALEKARAAERLYLRGKPPTVVVDIARVRLTGTDKPEAAMRTPRTVADSARASLVSRFARAIDLLDRDVKSAQDSLLLIRVDALTVAPVAAKPLGEAVDALRSGRDATDALIRARRLLIGTPVRSDSLSRWGVAW